MERILTLLDVKKLELPPRFMRELREEVLIADDTNSFLYSSASYVQGGPAKVRPTYIFDGNI